MAFMVPVMKKEFDIYKTGRSRRSSECSSSNASCRSRKVSECRSDCPSLSTSPGSDYIGQHPGAAGHPGAAATAAVGHPAAYHRSQSIPVNRNLSRTMLSNTSRSSSRTSQASLITSPTKQSATMMPGSNGIGGHGSGTGAGSGFSPPKPMTAGSQGSLNKFHQRLVDKLRKSLRKARSEDRS